MKRTSITLFLGIAAVVFALAAIAKQATRDDVSSIISRIATSQGNNEQQTINDLVVRVLDPKTRVQERWRALEKISAFPASRVQALSKIGASSSMPDVVMAVGRKLVLDKEPAIGFQILHNRFSILTTTSLTVFMREYLKKSYPRISAESLPLARDIINRELARSSKDGEGKKLPSREYTVGVSSLLLSSEPSKEDKALMRAAVHQLPLSTSLWSALAQSDAITSSEYSLGMRTYAALSKPWKENLSPSPSDMERDKLRDTLLIALSPHNKTIDNRLRERVQSFLKVFGKVPESELAGLYINYQHPTRPYEFASGMFVISRLRFVRVPFQQNSISECVEAQNLIIMVTACIVVADKYPSVFLKKLKDKGTRSSLLKTLKKEPITLGKILVFLKTRHPRYADQVNGIVSVAVLKQAEQEFAQSGIVSLLLGGSDNFLGL